MPGGPAPFFLPPPCRPRYKRRMLSLLLAAAVVFNPDPKDPRQRQLAAMADELQRAHKSLQLRGHEAPYFLSYAVRGIETQEIGAKYGAVFVDRRRRDKRLQVDVRVGTYQLDNTGSPEMFEFEAAESGYTAGRGAPPDDDPAALGNPPWRLTDGMLLEASRDFYGATESELPRGVELSKRIDVMVEELLALQKAPVLDPYTGPALLEPEAAGVLFHEAVGNRLEGERQNDDKDGRTFKGQVDKPILPFFLSVIDDPTERASGAVSLNGYYRFDDQGVPGQKTVLVDKGVLKTFLMSRAPVQGVPPHSNGHGRSAPGRDPVARMSNLIVESAKTMPWPKLKEALIAEAKRQEKPFGLVIRDVTGGNTDTSGYAYQAFKGQPRLVYKVDANTGAETLVRGVEIVGTPLLSINKIIATGDERRVFNGYCGAESGYVPVSTVAPTILVSEIELQRTRKDTGRPPVLPSPWAKPPVSATR